MENSGAPKPKKRQGLGRYLGFLVVLFIMFIYLVSGLVNLQLRQEEIYQEKAESTRTKTIALRGKRGNIISSDSVILAEDELIYNVTFYKDASTVSASSYKAYTASIIDTIGIIEKNGGEMAISFVIERDPESGEWVFNFGSGVSDSVLATRESQWRSNNYLTNLTRYDTAEKCIERLKARYQITDDIPEETMLKIMAIYSEMQMNIFNSQPIIIAKDVRYETVIEIETRSMMLPGMEIEIGTKRVYPRSTLAAQIIGYTGAIPSRAMWLNLQAKGYSYNDTIGRDGIESSMEDWLTQNSSLRKGSRVVERDQMSKVVRELSYTEPQDGNNVKLTLNAAYQAVAERAIAENVSTTRDLQERYLASDSWLEANKTDIHNRNWATYPLDLAEHGCLVVLDMQCRVLALANYPTYDLNALVAGGKEAMAILGDSRFSRWSPAPAPWWRASCSLRSASRTAGTIRSTTRTLPPPRSAGSTRIISTSTRIRPSSTGSRTPATTSSMSWAPVWARSGCTAMPPSTDSPPRPASTSPARSARWWAPRIRSMTPPGP